MGGKWSPAELPKCLPGQHPRLRWRRRKRSLDLRKARGEFLLNHYRNIKRQHYDHQNVESFVKIASKREKRDVENDGQNPKTSIVDQRETRSISKRDNRDYTEIDEAYSKYYESIKARYRNYVKNLFKASRAQNHQMIKNNTVPVRSSNGFKDSRIFMENRQNSPDFRYRSSNNMNRKSNEDEDYEQAGPPVALPSINDPIRTNRYEVESEVDPSVSNYYPSYVQQNHHEEPDRKTNTTDLLLAQLQSDMMRMKRDTGDDDGKGKLIGV